MIVSHRHRYIFVHIPKTGGTSLTLALEARVGRDDIILSDTPKGRNRRRRLRDAPARGRLWKHSTLADIEGLVDPAIFGDYLLFTLVRNPWARAVSYYRWLREQRFDHPQVRLAQRLGFGDFLRDQRTQAALAVPARHYLTASAGECAGHYLRLEHLDDDLPAIEAQLGFGLRPLPHANRSAPASGDWRGLYDKATAALVAHTAAEDIGRFGYRFDPD
ncbi:MULTISPECIES: sulfotransferase family 2 domain-containing protein [unclassified Paracoccus (in: a-proteobacteria)]|uniref:sulfotransferase family 2 domain-containing protein n=1 Tax=unclassified Paracoccus (in: a-proteobacteria) TaxID=2688777 RepID=UPI0012B34589|nr:MULTISPECIES: sulfotransferase family 2 domain-containing protein [unclassified Paracoccus (in: a-proteobacteria)]UXU75833.1 sulfotransferase family protein [Paracoccus sp. SMMA_5]UXU81742.1 sulfotransferase family protein [Paracoccus sp. SMMA_5_TC]